MAGVTSSTRGRQVVVELPSQQIVVDQLIRDCLDLPPDRRRRDLPAILLLGTRGSGKTALLKEIDRRCSSVRPCVLRDLGAHAVRPHEVAAQLAYGLERRVKQFGQLRFPRLLLGLVAIRSAIDRYNRERARAQLRRLLFDDRQDLMAKVREISDRLVDELHAPRGSKVVLGLTFDGVMATARTVKTLRGRGFMWYRQALDRQFQCSLDALIELNALEAERTPQTLAEVDEVLCGAFLADLRDAFTSGPRARLRTGNCVALIDNADSPTGQAFLEILASARSRHAEHTRQDCDPLVVVAAGHTRFPALALRDPRSPRQATYADWASIRDQDHNRGPEFWLYPVQLNDLDARELESLARRWPVAAAVDHAVVIARRLTHGHPWGFILILRAVTATAERDGAEAVDLRGILDWPDPDHPDRTLACGAIDWLLRGTPAELRQDLITCAAARDVGSRARWQALGSPSEELDRFCSTSLWVQPGMEDSPSTLHPFLRRVLLHALAGRWHAVHSRLRHCCRKVHEVVPEMYHTLALGELTPVVAHLDHTFAAVSKRAWVEELDAIAAAPRLAPPAGQTPTEQVVDLASHAVAAIGAPSAVAEITVLARVVAAVWISADPLGDPARTLDPVIAADFDRLAGNAVDAGHDPSPLLAKARLYRTRGQNQR